MSQLSDEDSFEGKSWVEICDAEQAREEKLQNESVNLSLKSDGLEEGEISDTDDSVNQSVEEEKTKDNFKIPSETWLFRRRADVSNSSERTNGTKNELLTTPEKSYPSECRTPISYAKALQGVKSEEDYIPLKTEPADPDDLSLTSHLDVFHVASPLKHAVKKEAETNILLDEDTVMYSPCKKEEIPVKNMKRPFQLIESPRPQPQKARDSNNHKIAKSVADSDVHSLNVEVIEECIASGSEDGKEKSVASPNLKRELEVNPEVLSRRQKQIDYGKNTLGYDRYTKAIPKPKRQKEHPKTPPKHLKMSRRAWDGLVRNWRLKLHKWDPISENEEIDFENANFDQYSFSSEEPSSYDSSSVRSDSAPSTPKAQSSTVECEEEDEKQRAHSNNKSECSKELWSNCQEETKESNNDDFLGCELLTENCVKAYS